MNVAAGIAVIFRHQRRKKVTACQGWGSALKVTPSSTPPPSPRVVRSSGTFVPELTNPSKYSKTLRQRIWAKIVRSQSFLLTSTVTTLSWPLALRRYSKPLTVTLNFNSRAKCKYETIHGLFEWSWFFSWKWADINGWGCGGRFLAFLGRKKWSDVGRILGFFRHGRNIRYTYSWQQILSRESFITFQDSFGLIKLSSIYVRNVVVESN